MLIRPGSLTLTELRILAREPFTLTLDPSTHDKIKQAAQVVEQIVARGDPAYGINTGFGKLASTHIPLDQLSALQTNLVLSHSVGLGELLDDEVVRLILVLKIASLARGYSGVRLEVIQALIALYNAKVCPCIPAKGSVGASGDLAPLAHLSAVLLGVGEARVDGTMMSAGEALKRAGVAPLKLAAKEGLALLNGTQVSTALALRALFATENIFAAAVVAGALTVDAARGSDTPFDSRIHEIRGHQGQIALAREYRRLLQQSEIRASHLTGDDRVQDPYSLRCQPQVMGACFEQISAAARVLLIEANAVSDNPLVFPETGEVLSGGNFHAEPVAFAADNLALAIAEIGALAERRIALLIDANLSGLPPFLVPNPGLHSGFMIAHVTAAALASENKSLAHPASVDSLPTSANQEDHVSMATFAARRLMEMIANTRGILAIELLAAAQGIDFHRPLKTSPPLQRAHELIRARVPFYQQDRFFAPDITAIQSLIEHGACNEMVELSDLWL